jgi:hypothetical protein
MGAPGLILHGDQEAIASHIDSLTVIFFIEQVED